MRPRVLLYVAHAYVLHMVCQQTRSVIAGTEASGWRPAEAAAVWDQSSCKNEHQADTG